MSNTKEKAPNNWHSTCQLTQIYEIFNERYFRNIKSTNWPFENSEPDSCDKNDMKEKVNDLVMLHKAMHETLHKKWSFPLRISLVNVTKSAGNCGFSHINWRNRQWKTSFFVQWKIKNSIISRTNPNSYLDTW